MSRSAARVRAADWGADMPSTAENLEGREHALEDSLRVGAILLRMPKQAALYDRERSAAEFFFESGHLRNRPVAADGWEPGSEPIEPQPCTPGPQQRRPVNKVIGPRVQKFRVGSPREIAGPRFVDEKKHSRRDLFILHRENDHALAFGKKPRQDILVIVVRRQYLSRAGGREMRHAEVPREVVRPAGQRAPQPGRFRLPNGVTVLQSRE